MKDGIAGEPGLGYVAGMSTVSEIESAIRELPAADFWKLADWFNVAKDEAWSKQMQADAEAGRLDFLFTAAATTQAAGTIQNWPTQA